MQAIIKENDEKMEEMRREQKRLTAEIKKEREEVARLQLESESIARRADK